MFTVSCIVGVIVVLALIGFLSRGEQFRRDAISREIEAKTRERDAKREAMVIGSRHDMR